MSQSTHEVIRSSIYSNTASVIGAREAAVYTFEVDQESQERAAGRKGTSPNYIGSRSTRLSGIMHEDRIAFLAGAFVSDANAIAQGAMRFSDHSSTNVLYPQLGQVFYVGTGHRGSELMRFVAPGKATKLVLGFAFDASPSDTNAQLDSTSEVKVSVGSSAHPGSDIVFSPEIAAGSLTVAAGRQLPPLSGKLQLSRVERSPEDDDLGIVTWTIRANDGHTNFFRETDSKCCAMPFDLQKLDLGGTVDLSARLFYKGFRLSATRTFTILGENDSKSYAAALATDDQEQTAWLQAIACQESASRHFVDKEPGKGSVTYAGNGDGGVGLMQITPGSTPDVAWNWRTNIALGKKLFFDNLDKARKEYEAILRSPALADAEKRTIEWWRLQGIDVGSIVIPPLGWYQLKGEHAGDGEEYANLLIETAVRYYNGTGGAMRHPLTLCRAPVEFVLATKYLEDTAEWKLVPTDEFGFQLSFAEVKSFKGVVGLELSRSAMRGPEGGAFTAIARWIRLSHERTGLFLDNPRLTDKDNQCEGTKNGLPNQCKIIFEDPFRRYPACDRQGRPILSSPFYVEKVKRFTQQPCH